MKNKKKSKVRLVDEVEEKRSDMSQFDETGVKSKDNLVEIDEYVQNFIEFAPYPVLILNEKGKIVLTNTQLKSLFGYSGEKLVGQSIEVLLPERFRAGHIEKLNSFLASPQSRTMGSGLELYAIKKDGSEFPVDISLSPLSSGAQTLIMSTIIDLSARKQDELDARERLTSFSKHNPAPVIRLDHEGKIIDANPSAGIVFKDDQLIGKFWNSISNGSSNIDSEKLLTEESSEQMEFEINEDAYLLSVKSLPEFGFIHVYFSDITNLKKAEKILRINLVQLEKKTKFESIINSVSRSVHQSISLDEVLENAVESLRENLDNVEFTSIYMVEGDYAALKASRGYPDWFVERTKKIPKPKGITWKTIIDGEPVYSPDTENDKYMGPAGLEAGVKSYYAIPLFSGDEVIGSININSKEKDAFDEEELKLLDMVAGQIEVAIKNANQAQELLRKTRVETILSSISSSVHQSISLDEVLENAVESLRENLDNVEFTGIYMVEGENAVLKSHRGFPDWFVERTKKIPKPKGMVWEMITEGKPVYRSDTVNDKYIGPVVQEVGIRSYYAIPLRYSGEVIGIISINSKEKDAFDEEELKLLDLVAGQVEVAIKNANQAQELLRKTRVETILSSISRSVHQSISLDEVLENAVESLRENLDNVEFTAIYMVEGDYAALKASRGFPDWFVERTKKIPKPKGITWKTIIDGKPLYSPDTENDKYMGPAGLEAGTKSYYAIPLRYGSEVIGSININSIKKDAFDEDELKLLDLVGLQIEVAINNANQAQELLRKTRVETIVSSVSSSVHQSISLDEVLENAVESLRENLDKVEFTAIYMVEGENAVLKSYRGFPDWFVERTKKIPKPKGITWKTIIDGKPLYSPDTDSDPNIGPAGREVGTKSYYAIPLVSGDQVIGSININSTEKDAFDEEELKLLDLVGTQIEVAINNAKQAQEREELIVELETKTAEMERFSYTVSHDLKSPLITIKGFLGMLERDITKGNAERAKTDMEHINAAADKMQSLLDELLELSRVGRVVNDPQDVSLVEIVYEAVGLCGGRIRDNGVKMDIASNLPVVYVDRQRYIEVFQNLIDNAVKFMGDQSQPLVEVGMQTKGGNGENIECYVRDNGMGIDSAYHDKVFSLFDTLDKDSGGTGIGLTIVKRIVEFHGGTIRVESEGIGHGTTFYFTIPAKGG